MQFDTFILLLYKEKIQSIKIIITKLHKNVQEKDYNNLIRYQTILVVYNYSVQYLELNPLACCVR